MGLGLELGGIRDPVVRRDLERISQRWPGDSGWHIVGNAGEPAFQNGWTHYDARVVKFRKIHGAVHLSGLAGSGTLAATMFVLPAGYRPLIENTFTLVFPVVANGALGVVDIWQDGRVQVTSGSNVWVSLAGITFVAAGGGA